MAATKTKERKSTKAAATAENADAPAMVTAEIRLSVAQMSALAWALERI